MKIKDARVFVCSPGRHFVTLKVYTDEGIYGLGDCTPNGRELSVASYLTDHVIPCIIGRDPFQTEDIRQNLYRGAYWRKGPVTMSAIAAVDMALWDIKGRALNTPLYNLLGGKSRCFGLHVQPEPIHLLHRPCLGQLYSKHLQRKPHRVLRPANHCDVEHVLRTPQYDHTVRLLRAGQLGYGGSRPWNLRHNAPQHVPRRRFP